MDRYDQTNNGQPIHAITLSRIQYHCCLVSHKGLYWVKKSTMYTKPLGKIIRDHGLCHHFYADDTQLYLSFIPSNINARENSVTSIEACITDIQSWMTKNMLKLNGDKTEVVTFSPKWKINEPISVQIGNSSLTSTETVKNLGVWFDATILMETHVNGICKSAYMQLHNISHIRHFLTTDVCTSYNTHRASMSYNSYS